MNRGLRHVILVSVTTRRRFSFTGRAAVVLVACSTLCAAIACNGILGIPAAERLDGEAGPGPGSCAPGQKTCNGACVSVLDPSNGCAAEDCRPCALAHAKNACVDRQCAIEVCEEGFGNCNASRADGCEADLRSDPRNCDTCGNDCQGFGCTAGVCRCTTNDSCGFNGVCAQQTCECGPTTCSPGSPCDGVDSCGF